MEQTLEQSIGLLYFIASNGGYPKPSNNDGNIEIHAEKDLSIKITGNTRFDVTGDTEIKTSGNTKIESTGSVEVKGISVKINGASNTPGGPSTAGFCSLPNCLFTGGPHSTNTLN